MKSLLYLFLLFLMGCFGNGDNESDPISELSKQTGRDSWQKPELVIEAIGETKGKTVADIGAGTGYFTFRLAFSAKKVIAIEIDQNMIDLIELFRVNLPPDIKDNIETRLVKPTETGLELNEVDIAVIINTIGYIDNPVQYLQKLKEGINTNGQIAIVDFKNKYLTIDAPPVEERVSQDSVTSYLSQAGYTNIKINTQTLDYQYIITAQNQ